MRRLDNKRELVDYFKKNLSKNYTAESLKFALINQGYSRAAIDQALEQANKELSENAPKLPKEKPIIKYEVYDQNNKPINVEPFTFWEKVVNFFRGRRS
jgi:SOS response regulatory protein OraA/RecX